MDGTAQLERALANEILPFAKNARVPNLDLKWVRCENTTAAFVVACLRCSLFLLLFLVCLCLCVSILLFFLRVLLFVSFFICLFVCLCFCLFAFAFC